MPRIKTLTLAMSAVSMMAGCASTQPAGESGLKMEAVQRVTHGQSSPEAFYRQGRYYHGQARYNLALTAYRQALELQPRHVDALTGMGVVYATLGQYDEALRLFGAAASLDPGSATARNNLGYIHWLRNEHEQALQAYRQALKLDPLNARARDNLRLAMKDAANDPFQAATESQPVAPQVAQEDRSTAAQQDAGPQLYELREPAPAVPVTIDQRGESPAQASLSSAPGAVASEQAGADSRLSLNEVAPQVYELRMPVKKTVAVSPPPEQVITTGTAAGVRPTANAADSTSYLEVMNGNGVTGIARKVSRYLVAQGYPSAGARNLPHFNEVRTRIEYRPGHAEQARRLNELLPGQAVLSETAALGGRAKIRLVLGNDIRQLPATWSYDGGSLAAGATDVPSLLNGLQLAVANGNGVKGIARKVADYLSGLGYGSASVYDLRPFNKTVSRIEYRKGYANQAIKLGDQLPGKVALVEADELQSDVRLVLGHDIKQDMAGWSPEAVRLAEAKAADRL
jgi:tetratricopeptide (TPR) repeat protein